MSALARLNAKAMGSDPIGKIDPVVGAIEKEGIRETNRWVQQRGGNIRPYNGPALTGEGTPRGGAAGPVGRRATVISGATRRTSMLGY